MDKFIQKMFVLNRNSGASGAKTQDLQVPLLRTLPIEPNPTCDEFIQIIIGSEQALEETQFMCLSNVIVSNILLRLPADSIWSSRLVCKRFYSLINDTQFVELQLQKSKCQEPHVLLKPYPSFSSKYYWIHIGESKNIYVPNYGGAEYGLFPQASCNGLICLSYSFDIDIDPVVIFNPITTETLKLPNSTPMEYHDDKYIGIGFGYDAVHKKYKVLRVYTTYKKDSCTTTCEIITTGETSWRQLVLPDGVTYMGIGIVFHNDAFYWQSKKLEDKCIVVMEFNNEQFHIIEFSPQVSALDPLQDWDKHRVTIFENFLAIAEERPKDTSTSLRIWKLTGNKTTGYCFCCHMLQLSETCQQFKRLIFSGTLSHGNYLLKGLRLNGVRGHIGILNQRENEEGSIQARYTVARRLHNSHMLLVMPSLVSPCTFVGNQYQQSQMLKLQDVNFMDKLWRCLACVHEFLERNYSGL